MTGPRVEVTTKKRYVHRVTAADIITLVGAPFEAEVTVVVPTGGDWAGERLDIGSDIPYVSVSWETEEVS